MNTDELDDDLEPEFAPMPEGDQTVLDNNNQRRASSMPSHCRLGATSAPTTARMWNCTTPTSQPPSVSASGPT
jgi:hypothetical protein